MRLLLAALAVLVASQAQAQTGDPPAWSRAYPPFHIADNLYFVGTEGLASFLITTPAGLILIDGTVPGQARGIEANIRTLGFKPGDVKILLNTHAHFDHAGSLADLKKDTGAKLYAMAGDVKALESGTYPGSEERKDLDFPPVKVDHVLKDRETVALGGVALTANLTPGHTAGCTAWTFPLKVDGQVRQALLYCSTSVALNRLVSKTRGPQYPGIVADYEKALARLKTLKADVFLAPHAEQFDMAGKRARLGKGANPFVDPMALPKTVAESEAAFRKELAKQEGAAR
jgi:metallo-beta-lactamase class B